VLISRMFLLRLGLAALALWILTAMFAHLEDDGSLSLPLAKVFSFAFLICLIAFVVLCIAHIGERRSKP
jgi:uncharacterized membrane protein YhdT